MPRIVRAAMVLGLLCLVSSARPALAAMPSDAEMESLVTAARDTLRAGWAEVQLRQVAAEAPTPLVPLVRHLVMMSLITQRAGTPRLLAYADSALTDTSLGEWPRSQFSTMVANELLRRDDRLDWADAAVRAALGEPQASERDSATADEYIELLARILIHRDRSDSAIALLEPRVAARPEAQRLLWRLGIAYQRTGRLDQAIDLLVRADAVTWADTSVAPQLREAWTKRHGSLDGLDARLAASRALARRVETFERARVDRPAPAWSLPTLDGRRRSSRELAGRITVLEFWGSWCPGCLVSLPDLVKMMKEPRFKDVGFLGVNCEPPMAGPDARGRIRSLMREQRWTFPTVQDTTYATQEAFGVQAFPTSVVIDRAGRVRFRNLGSSPDNVVLRDQLAALMEEERAARKR